ncbi:DUF3883 domain-containing protein [Mollicutes bacterium LVI A0078]|nr:DUF3883 domain-containing protein [Mollicutes bacterium LVI A0075]WOO90501.1 DUF3883 domain-containing protein [Mollicutes bacterium LVI A0078]
MHTENQIKRAIKPLLDVYGELTITEVKQKLNTVLSFDSDDKEESPTRKEMKILQRIGNVVSHQKEKRHYYTEGYIVDKNFKPAKFILVNPITKTVIESDEVDKRKKQRKNFTAKKVDWDKIRDRNDEVGDQGEEFVMEYEIDRLVENNVENSKSIVQHLSRLQGDGLGYDISSINFDGSTRFIEVKTTTREVNAPFYMSRNEKNFFEIYGEQAFIYRVYNFSRETRNGEVKIITAEELFNKYDFDPITWKVTPKI